MSPLAVVLPLLLAAAPPPATPDVAALVRQLGADVYAERVAATRALEKIGAPALRPLRRALSSPDLEVRRRARRLVDTIEAQLFGEVRVFAAEAGSVNAVAFSPDGRHAASADSRGVRLWDVATGRLLAHNDNHADRVIAVTFSPDGKLLATGSEDLTARLWEVPTLKERQVLRRHKGPVRAVAFDSSGARLVSGGADGLIQEWDVKTAAPAAKVWSMRHGIHSLAIRPGTSRALLALGNDGGVGSYDLASKTVKGQLVGHAKAVLSLALSRDGSRAVTASLDTTLRLWDAQTLRCLRILEGHTAGVCGVAVSPDGRWAVSGGHDKVLRLWDLEEGRHVREFRGHEKVIWSVAFSPNGKYALSGSHDGTMRLWAMGP